MFSIRSFQYKYNYYYCDHNTEEFFDLIHDPHENTNLINNTAYQGLIQEYRWKLDSFKTVFGDNLIEEIRECSISNPVFINDTVSTFSEDSFVFYPNPCPGELQIKFATVDSGEAADIAIYNTQGLAVFHSNKILVSAGNKYNVDLNNLSDGIYSIQFRFNKKTFMSKLVIVK